MNDNLYFWHIVGTQVVFIGFLLVVFLYYIRKKTNWISSKIDFLNKDLDLFKTQYDSFFDSYMEKTQPNLKRLFKFIENEGIKSTFYSKINLYHIIISNSSICDIINY